jgi:GAF domain-containing protein/HAMP domain-containing protein
MVIMGIGLAITMTRAIARPITQLSEAARQITAGNLAVQAPVRSQDETGQLATTFNNMTSQLRDLINTLEARVAGRTRQVETVMEISQRLSSILDVSDLMREVVNRTKETFNYYHVHIYLLDKAGETLFMAEGYGQAGEEMKRQAHHIPLMTAKSLVARAAREGKVVTAANVRDDADWLPNPLLPNTHSEMAVPVLLGTEVVGVLDVQSEQIGGLGQEDEAALQALANQVATAVRNARLFAETQEALYSVQQLQELYTGQAWEKFGDNRSITDYDVSRSNLPALQDTPIPEAIAALQQGQTVELSLSASEGIQAKTSEISEWGEPQQPKIYRALATPLKLRDQTLGVLGIQTDDPKRRWTEDEIALIEAVSEQMSLAIENARLFEETGRRAGRERIIADVTQQVWASGELEQVMQTTVEQLGIKLDAAKVIIRLGTEDQLLPEVISDPLEPEERNGSAKLS